MAPIVFSIAVRGKWNFLSQKSLYKLPPQRLLRRNIPSRLGSLQHLFQGDVAALDQLREIVVLDPLAVLEVGQDLLGHLNIRDQGSQEFHVFLDPALVGQESGMTGEITPIFR